MPAECHGALKGTVLSSVIQEQNLDEAGSESFWVFSKTAAACSCGTAGGVKLQQGQQPSTGSYELMGWDASTLCGETTYCVYEIMAGMVGSMLVSDTTLTEAVVRPQVENQFYAMCNSGP